MSQENSNSYLMQPNEAVINAVWTKVSDMYKAIILINKFLKAYNLML